jgi:hypothetical protein
LTPSPPAAPPSSPRARTLTLALAGLAAVPLWLAPVVPTTDGPSHLYNAWLLLHWGDPSLGAGRLFRIDAFVPNWGGVGPLVPLLAVLPPPLAEKAYLSAIVVGLVLTAAALATRLGGDPILAGASAGVLAHGWLLAAGFTGFLASLALGIGACAVGDRLLAASPSRPARLRRAVGLNLAFVALFFLHLAGAILAAGAWALLLAARVRGGLPRRRALAVGAPPMVLLAALVLAHWAGGAEREVPLFRGGPAPGWSRLLDLGTGAYWQAYSAGDRPVGMALTLLTLGLIAARATHRGPSGGGARWLTLGAGGLFVAYLVVPWAAGGGAFLTDRLVPCLFLLSLPWATSAGLPARGLFRTALVVLLVGALAHRTAQYRYWGAVQSSVVALNHGLPEGGVLVEPPPPPLPMAVDPLVHIWGRVGIDRRALALDNYEALLVGWFPLSFGPEGRALADAWRERGTAPPGARILRYE